MSTSAKSQVGNDQDDLAAWLHSIKDGKILATAAETHAAGAELATHLPPDSVVLLSGDLGAGKTTFVQGVARGLGIAATVKSPTYNYYSIYQGTSQLIHCDAYRMNSGHDMEGLLLEEFLKSPWCLCLEWPEMVKEWIPQNALRLRLQCLEDGIRKLVIHTK